MYTLKSASRKALRRALAVAVAMLVPVVAGAAPASAAAWQVVASPNSSANDGLAAVAAISPSDLWAVGLAYGTNSTSANLIENYNGTAWQIAPNPAPPG